MSAIAIAPSPLRPPCGGWGRPLYIPLCRCPGRAPTRWGAIQCHRMAGRALNAVGGSAAHRYALFALAGYRALHCACVHPSPHFPLPRGGCLTSPVFSALRVVTSGSRAYVLPSPHFPLPPRGGLASSASSGLSPLGRCRRFGSLAPALLVVSVLGSPLKNAIAWGSSLPTTARPHFQ